MIAITSAVRVEQIGNATLYLGDCREIVPTLQRPTAIISDPPYGQRQNTNVVQKGGIRVYGQLGERGGNRVIRARVQAKNGTFRGSGESTVWPDVIAGDDEPFPMDLLRMIFAGLPPSVDNPSQPTPSPAREPSVASVLADVARLSDANRAAVLEALRPAAVVVPFPSPVVASSKRGRPAGAKPKLTDGQVFWSAHRSAQEAIAAEHGLAWKIKAPGADTVLATLPARFRSSDCGGPGLKLEAKARAKAEQDNARLAEAAD